jgi:hypothetical protein
MAKPAQAAAGPQRLAGLPQLPARLRPGEVAAERRVRDAIVTGQRAHRFAARAAAKQLRVRHEPAQSRLPLHPNSTLAVTHQQRTNPSSRDRRLTIFWVIGVFFLRVGIRTFTLRFI